MNQHKLHNKKLVRVSFDWLLHDVDRNRSKIAAVICRLVGHCKPGTLDRPVILLLLLFFIVSVVVGIHEAAIVVILNIAILLAQQEQRNMIID